jgi:cyclic beta-1,2-glucan synthetase
MGGGDWNDGMNRVGIEGRGESVWLAWFLTINAAAFCPLVRARGDQTAQANATAGQADVLLEAIEQNAWDGDWYLRAFDDGAAWLAPEQRMPDRCHCPVLVGALWAGDPPAAGGQACGVEHLVRPTTRLLLLFTPPFDQTPRDPGYIKGYLPGIRENGGQYTHAAIWTVWAFAELGDHGACRRALQSAQPDLPRRNAEDARALQGGAVRDLADVYGVPPHTGAGGWTLVYRLRGWMYRLGLEGPEASRD